MKDREHPPQVTERASATVQWPGVADALPVATAVTLGVECVWANTAFCTLLARPRDQVVGRDIRDFVAEPLRTELDAAIAERLRTERGFAIEGPIMDGEGSQRWVGINVAIVGAGDAGDATVIVQLTDLTDLHRARTELMASERRQRSLLHNISDVVSVSDAEGRLLFTTSRQKGALLYDGPFWDDLLPIDLVHPDDRQRAVDGWLRTLEQPQVEVSEEVRMRQADNTWADVAVTSFNLPDDPDVGGLVLTARNVTQIRAAQRLSTSQATVLDLIARREPLDHILESCIRLVEDNGVDGQTSIYRLEDNRLELQAGRAPAALNDYMRVPGRRPDRSLCDGALAGVEWVQLEDIDNAPELDAELRTLCADLGLRSGWSIPVTTSAGIPFGTISTVFRRLHRASEHERRVGELAANLVAVAVEREATANRLAHQAVHDALTGLPNRTLLMDRLEQALLRQRGTDGEAAVLFCDLDRFKVVNDSLGHGVGDQILVAVAERLLAAVAPGDTVARFGGDEFVIVIDDPEGTGRARQVAERVATSLQTPFMSGRSQDVVLTASIGLAPAEAATTPESWLAEADTAMYRAKDLGRNRTEPFGAAMRDAAVARLEIEHDLRGAVDRDEMVVHYQPVIDLASGRIVGAEALVRWDHPGRGLLSPAHFIHVAEEIGAIDPIGRFVLDRAAADFSAMATRVDIETFQLGVNISAHQLSSDRFAATVEQICRSQDWPLDNLMLEITETILTWGAIDPVAALTAIKALGATLAIDDFGTGHSSLARLGRVPADQVKIDCSFVAAINGGSERLVRMVDAVIAVAGALDLCTCAEGVETTQQLDYLRRRGCEQAQGYLFSRPVPVEDFETLLATDPRW